MKKRLDVIVSEKFEMSRTKAQALIMAGEVLVDEKVFDKVGQTLDEEVGVELKQKLPYVSRGALKLEKAYREFGLDFKGKVICDVGASTGGFTDFSLQNGAAKVYAIDTGKGQIDQKLRDDARVILMENTNIREVEKLPETIDFFVIDVSFISLKKVLPAVQKIGLNSSLRGEKIDEAILRSPRSARDDKRAGVVALIKPQFEVGKEIADKTKGIIKDQKLQLEVVEQIGNFAEELGYKVQALTDSPITGAKGNKEFLIYLTS